jgi:hypothetical protein
MVVPGSSAALCATDPGTTCLICNPAQPSPG